MSALSATSAAELLLAYGAKPDSTMHSRGPTPLHLAAMGGYQGVVDALLKAAPPGVNLGRIGDNKVHARLPWRGAATRRSRRS